MAQQQNNQSRFIGRLGSNILFWVDITAILLSGAAKREFGFNLVGVYNVN
jgi:hypothetical protein